MNQTMPAQDLTAKPGIPGQRERLVWVLATKPHAAAGIGPSLVQIRVAASDAAVSLGEHLVAAREAAEKEGWQAPTAFDNRSPAGVMLEELMNFQSIQVQDQVPGDPVDTVWKVRVGVMCSMSADVYARGGTADEAILNARSYVAGEGRHLLGVDDASAQRTSDFYCTDRDGVERIEDEAAGVGLPPVERSQLSTLPAAKLTQETEETVRDSMDRPRADEPSGFHLSRVLVEVLHPANEAVDGRSLEDIAGAIDDGDWLGQPRTISV